MKVTVNGYTINDVTSTVYLNDQIEGLELPPVRTTSGDYAGRDGGFVGPQLYSLRDITLTGSVFNADVSTLEQTRRNLQAALATKSVTLNIVTNAGSAYVIYCNLIDFKMPIKRELFQADFKIELLAGDTIVYDDTAGGALTATVARQVSGGYTYPVVFPVVYGAGTSPTTVTNGGAGNISVYPIITLTGIMSNPVITNTTTGAFLQLSPLVTASGDVVIIDMRAKTVTLNGGNIFPKVTSASSWWSLQPGGNTIALTTGSGSDTVSAVVSWRSGYYGI